MTVTMKDVEVPGAPAPAYVALPEAPRGAVVVLHEIFGRAPEMERVCVRIAEKGYAALMPDLFGSRFKPLCIARALKQIHKGEGESIDVIKAAAQTVSEHSGVPRERVGVIGFCLGGGFALATGNAFRATSTNYGEVPEVSVMRGIGPTIGCYATRDKAYKKSAATLEERLKILDVPHEVHMFEAGHAFLADGDHPVIGALSSPILSVDPAKDAAVREQGWAKIFAFFDTHLAT